MPEYRINLAKAAAAEHSEYMFRLMFALNDLLATRQLQELLANVEQPRMDGLSAYLIRITQAHLVEACIAFVETVRPSNNQQPQHSVYEFIKAQPAVFKLFQDLDEKSRTSDFSRLRKLRNTFVFHYNYRDHGSDTQTALAQLLQKSKNCGSGNENLIVRGDELNSRFIVADELVNAGWRMIVGINECADFTNDPKTKAYRSFLGSLASVFLQYAETTVLAWIATYSLQA